MLASAMIAVIRFYQRCLGPFKPPCCRFQPTCSEYARLAILAHGPARGVWLGVVRIGRCHPWGGYGCDPVPEPSPPCPRRNAVRDGEAARP